MKSEVNITCVESGDTSQTEEKHDTPGVNPVVVTWPTEPKALSLSTQEQAIWAAYDGALIALPVFLMIKTTLCIYAHHVDRHNIGTSIDSASFLSGVLVDLNSQLVTLFTIVFITIMSTFVKRFALWKAEHGAYVADLEQLQGSVSLPSTLKLVWSLRSFGLRSVLLVLVWSFYYLGSQAVKSEYQLSLSCRSHRIKAAVQKSNAPSCFDTDLETVYSRNGYSVDLNWFGTDIDRLNTYFTALMLQEEHNAEGAGNPQTNPGYRNGVLIPDYETSLSMQSQNNIIDKLRYKFEGWIDTSHHSKLTYLSDTGTSLWLSEISIALSKPQIKDGTPILIPHADQQLLGSYTLHNISYLNFDCQDLTILPLSAFPNKTDVNTYLSFNMTAENDSAPRDVHGNPLREFIYSYRGWAVDPRSDTDPTTDPCPYKGDNVTFPENDPDIADEYYNLSQRTLQSTCYVSLRFVDMQVSCVATGCYPQRLRWANNTSEVNATSYSTPFDNDDFAARFFDNFIRSSGQQSSLYEDTLVGDS